MGQSSTVPAPLHTDLTYLVPICSTFYKTYATMKLLLLEEMVKSDW